VNVTHGDLKRNSPRLNTSAGCRSSPVAGWQRSRKGHLSPSTRRWRRETLAELSAVTSWRGCDSIGTGGWRLKIRAIAALAGGEGSGAEGQIVDLRQVWAQITDPRDRRGRRHSVVVILALVQAAVVSGATTFAAIRHWIGAVPQHVLAGVDTRRDPRTGLYQAPHPDTVCRVLEQVNAAEVDAAYARYRAAQLSDLYDDPSELVPMTVDGKTQRGAGHGEIRARHRLGVMLAADAITVAQLDVSCNSNEISAFIPLLDQIPLSDERGDQCRRDVHPACACHMPVPARRVLRPTRGRQPGGPVRPARRARLAGRPDRLDHL
jgi:hypothetical protein